ncbi:MAG TPA: hypothetical protein DIT13_16440 [Verrucomicrobiales bacterium]|nr:hypothetical protein [Verrucomicrobiales bacterium]
MTSDFLSRQNTFRFPMSAAPTKQRMVYDTLRSEIVSGRLQPGQALVIDALARRFAVSIIPVREALRQLQSERLVEIRPHTGVRVAGVEVSALTEIFCLLDALETATALRALPKMTADDLSELEELIHRLDAAVEAGDMPAFELANREFHLLPCRVAGFPRAEEMLKSLLGEWERLHRMAFQNAAPPDPQKANREHRAILRAFRAGDADALAQTVRKHNAGAAAHYERHLRSTAN